MGDSSFPETWGTHSYVCGNKASAGSVLDSGWGAVKGAEAPLLIIRDESHRLPSASCCPALLAFAVCFNATGDVGWHDELRSRIHRSGGEDSAAVEGDRHKLQLNGVP